MLNVHFFWVSTAPLLKLKLLCSNFSFFLSPLTRSLFACFPFAAWGKIFERGEGGGLFDPLKREILPMDFLLLIHWREKGNRGNRVGKEDKVRSKGL